MKLNKFIKSAAVLLAALTALAGCKFQGTTTSFKGNEESGYKAVKDEVTKPGFVRDPVIDNFDTANKKAELRVVIISQGKLDEKSIDKAVDVYTLNDAADDYFACVRGSALPKTLRKIDVNEYENGTNYDYGQWYYNAACVETVIEYYVDTSSVTKDAVAFVVDAAKLKEKTGALILNGDGNEKCGEASDSYIDYFDIHYKADGSSADALKGFRSENFCPSSPFFDLSCLPDGYEESDGKRTGALFYKVDVASQGLYKSSSSSYIYPDTFAAALGKMYAIRTLPMGAQKWTETPLSFTYDAGSHSYQAKSPVLEYGTKYSLVTKENNALEWTAAKDWFGHAPRLAYTKNKTSYEDPDTWTYLKESPAYILGTPSNGDYDTEVPYTSAEHAPSSFESIQGAVFSVTPGTGLFKIDIAAGYKNNNIRFASYDGFVITDDMLNIVKTKAPVVYEEDETGVYSILLELENKNLGLNNYKLWVGEKTTIKANKYFPVQLKFGCPAIEEADRLTGYILIENNLGSL